MKRALMTRPKLILQLAAFRLQFSSLFKSKVLVGPLCGAAPGVEPGGSERMPDKLAGSEVQQMTPIQQRWVQPGDAETPQAPSAEGRQATPKPEHRATPSDAKQQRATPIHAR